MNMTVAEYNQKVDNTNAELKLMRARSTNVLFWLNIWHVRRPGAISRDGVHLNSNATNQVRFGEPSQLS